jgi:hypothetical protein
MQFDSPLTTHYQNMALSSHGGSATNEIPIFCITSKAMLLSESEQ